ncbi:hypothetical protein CU254_41330 (plasmid) [Amycolatopsis sp. AA4]|uniref:hypothetical protein n=1 Tax=Actinomycetes TaxID=1760 RepID=UPI0001B55C11|nr:MULTISPECIES: hypothetical protein [Actinomycetes]ATY17031.1 hypothetical protein CU254_41330 [Amycolatopsis sp. AA4]
MSAVVVPITSRLRTPIDRHAVSIVARDVGAKEECWRAINARGALEYVARDIRDRQRLFVELHRIDEAHPPQSATIVAARNSTVLALGTAPFAGELRAVLDGPGGCAGLSLARLPESLTPLQHLQLPLPRGTRTILENAGFTTAEELAAVPPENWTQLGRVAAKRTDEIAEVLAVQSRHRPERAAQRRDRLVAGLAPSAVAHLARFLVPLAESDLPEDVAADIFSQLALAPLACSAESEPPVLLDAADSDSALLALAASEQQPREELK